jgi:hypothetical protein
MARKKPEAPATPAAAPDLATVMAAMMTTMQGIDQRLARIENGDVDDRGAEPRAANRRTNSRSGQERAATARKAEEKIMPHMAYHSILFVDPSKIPPESEYFWVRESTMGQADDANVTTHQMAGWRPVPASRHPELIPPALPGREQEIPTCIRRPGLILMEKDSELVRQGREYLRRQNLQTLRSQIKGDSALRDDDRMPWEVHKDAGGIESVREFK